MFRFEREKKFAMRIDEVTGPENIVNFWKDKYSGVLSSCGDGDQSQVLDRLLQSLPRGSVRQVTWEEVLVAFGEP